MLVKARRLRGLGASSFRSTSSGGSASAAPAQLPSGYQMVGFNPQAFNSLRPAAYREEMAKTSAGSRAARNQPSIIMAPTYSAPAAPPPTINVSPNITTTTAVSPNLQQSFTPQVSPVFQQSSGSGSQGAGTTQQADGGQSGQGGGSAAPGGSTTGQGINAAELLAILNAQSEQARLQREADNAARLAEQQEAQRIAQQEATRAAQQAAASAAHSQYTGSAPRPLLDYASAPATASASANLPAAVPPATVADNQKLLLIGGAIVIGGAILYAATRKKSRGAK